MERDEKREPTLGEIMEEVKRSREEVVKNIESSRVGIWIAVIALAFSAGLFGLGTMLSVRLVGGVWWPAAVMMGVGFGAIVLVWRKIRREEERFEAKWHEAAKF